MHFSFNTKTNSILFFIKKRKDKALSLIIKKTYKTLFLVMDKILRAYYLFKNFSFFKNLSFSKKINQKGQGLIEYLILIALMGVATIGIMRTLNQTVKARFANAIYALQGRSQKAKTQSVNKKDFQKSDLSNFMNGAASSKEKKKKSKKQINRRERL